MASVDITALGIQVTSSGISEAAKSLDGLVTSARNAEKAFPGLKVAAENLNATQKSSVDAVSKLMEKLQKQADLLGKNQASINAYNAEMKGANQAQIELARTLGAEVDAHKAATAAMKAQEAAAKKLASAHGEINLLTAGSTREFIVLGHELMTGNFNRFGGSLVVFSERINFLPKALASATAMAESFGVSLGVLLGIFAATVGAVIAFGVAIFKGAAEQKAFNDALLQTGNYAGTTATELERLSHAAASSGGSLSEARKATLELAASGKFTASQIRLIAEAATLTEKAFGVAIDTTIKQFETLATEAITSGNASTDVISKHTVALNDHYHFLTVAQFEAITNLEKEGDAFGAAALAEEAFATSQIKRAKESIENLGYLARAWNAVKEAIGGAWGALESIGKKDTLDDLIKQTKVSLNALYSDHNLTTKQMASIWGTLSQKLVDLYAQKNAGILAAEKAGEVERAKEATIGAERRIRTVTEQYDKQAKAFRVLKEFENDWEKSSNAYKLKNLAEYNTAHAALVKATQKKEVKAPGQGLAKVNSEIAAAEEIFRTQNEMLNESVRLDKEANKHKEISAQERFNLDKDLFDKRSAIIKTARDTEMRATEDYNKKAKNSATLALEAETKRSEIKTKYTILDLKNNNDRIVSANDLAYAEGAPERAAQKTHEKFMETAGKEIKTIQDKIDAYNRLPEAIKAAGVTEKQMADQVTQSKIDDLEFAQFFGAQSAQEAANTQKEIDKLVELQRVQKDYENIQNANKNALAAPAMQKADAAAQIEQWKSVGNEIEKSLTNAFGNAGKAAGAMFKAYAEGNANSIHITQKLAEQEARNTAEHKSSANDIANANHAMVENQLNSYGNLADAAASFFDKQSIGYKVMNRLSQAYHLAEVAYALASIPAKEAAGSATMFAQSGWGAFAGTAAMVAVVAGFGAAIGGGGSGGGQSAADVQKAQGAGSVFGDAEAKSDSIKKSIDLLSNNSSTMLPLTSSMAASLKNIETSMAGLTNLVVRSTGVTDASNMGIQTGTTGRTFGSNTLHAMTTPAIDAIFGAGIINTVNKIFSLWGKTTQNIVDSGLQFGGSVKGLQSGQGYNQYASVDTTKSSWFGLSKSTSSSVQTQGLSSELTNQFGMIFKGLETTLKTAATTIGANSEQVGNSIENLVIDTTKVSLKGLTGQALQDALNAVISKTMDQIAQAAFPEMEQFRQVGEGYAQTVVRVTNDYEQVKTVFEYLGKTLTATGIDGVKMSEGLVSAAGGMNNLAKQTQGFIKDYLTEAEQMAPVTKAVNAEMARLGESNVTTIAQFKALVLSQDLTTASGQQMYAALIAIESQFKQVADYTNGAAEAMRTASDIASERKGLQDQLDQLTMTSAQLLEKQRNALDASNRSLFDQIQAITAANQAAADAKALADKQRALDIELMGALGNASGQLAVQRADELAAMDASLRATQKAIWSAQDNTKTIESTKSTLTEAYQRESSALQGVIDKFKSFSDTLKKFKDSLLAGDLSTLSPQQKYELAKSKFQTTSALAATGNEAALGDLQNVSQEFLNASRGYNASTEAYAKDFNLVQKGLEDGVHAADTQVSIAQSQLAVMNAQYTSLVGIQAGVVSFKDALAAYTAAKTGPAANSVFSSLTSGGGIPYTPQQLLDASLGKVWSERDMGKAWMAAHPISNNLQYTPLDGSHEGGLDYVPKNNYIARLHVGEKVSTAASVKAADKNQAELVALTQQLLVKMESIDCHVGASNTQRAAVHDAQVEVLEKVVSKVEDVKKAVRNQPVRK